MNLKRLILFIELAFGNNNTRVARLLEIRPQNLSQIKTGNRGIGKKIRSKLEAIGLNLQWLDYGTGDMYADNEEGRKLKLKVDSKIEETKSDFFTEPHKEYQPRTVYDTNENESRIVRFKNLKDEELMMKYANYPVGAGYQPAGDVDVHDIDIISILTYNKQKSYFAEVAGDSMIGADIYPGDFVIINTSFVPENEDIVVVFINGDLLVKRFRIIKNERYLVSDNTAYLPIKINGDDEVNIFGVVESILHKVRKRDKI